MPSNRKPIQVVPLNKGYMLNEQIKIPQPFCRKNQKNKEVPLSLSADLSALPRGSQETLFVKSLGH